MTQKGIYAAPDDIRANRDRKDIGKLVVLDCAKSIVHFFDVHPDTDIADIDKNYIRRLGFHTSECSWMVGRNVDIVKHKGMLK